MKHTDPRIDAQVEALNKLHGKREKILPPVFERKVMPPENKKAHKKLYESQTIKKPEPKRYEKVSRVCLKCGGKFWANDRTTRLCSESCRRDDGGLGPMGSSGGLVGPRRHT